MANTIPIVVSPAWLKSAIDAKNKNLVVLDATWIPQAPEKGMPKTTGKAVFESKHIPGALHFDVDACITKTQFIPRNLPEPAEFQAYLRTLGIDADSHVVFYDRDDGKLMLTGVAPRSCFILKLYGHKSVSILDGGLVKWEALGYSTESGPAPSPKTGDFVVNYQADMVVDFDQMLAIERSGDHQIVDSRLDINFNGEEEEPCDFIQLALIDAKQTVPKVGAVRKGHMQNAVNIPFLSVYMPSDGVSYKKKEDLEKLFRDQGLDLNKPTVFTCYIGHTAAMLAALAFFCGYHNLKVYYGSWTEHCQRKISG